jgi:hypothetical protein
MPDSTGPLLTLIIPAYNEERRLPKSLDQIAAFVQQRRAHGSDHREQQRGPNDRDRGGMRAHYPFVRVLHSPKERAAVRTGMMEDAAYLFICDSDLSMPIAEVRKFLPPLLEDYDVAIASREGPGAHRYGEPGYRHLMGRVFNFIVRVLAVPGFQDTQCGFKSFRAGVGKEVFADLTMTGWVFDVEALFIAQRRGYRVVAVPIDWYFDADSRIEPLRDTWRMFRDVLRIRVNGWRGVYDGETGRHGDG